MASTSLNNFLNKASAIKIAKTIPTFTNVGSVKIVSIIDSIINSP
jgi:hypothetical protein